MLNHPLSSKLALHVLALCVPQQFLDSFLGSVKVTQPAASFAKTHRRKVNRRKVAELESQLDSCNCPPEYLTYFMKSHLAGYDHKNLSHYMQMLSEFVTKQGKNYCLKKDGKTFQMIYMIMKQADFIAAFRESIYYNAQFMPSADLKQHTINSKDAEELISFQEFKTGERATTYDDSHTLRMLLIAGMSNQTSLSKVLRKKRISIYAFLRMLEAGMYLTEFLQGEHKINEAYLEKCILFLYEGQARDIEKAIYQD